MELDVIFSRELHKKLKERIKGKVLVPIMFFMKLLKNTRGS